MKPLLPLTLFFTLAGEITSHAQDTNYYNLHWKETTVDSASFYRVKVKSSAGWQVIDYYMSGKIEMTGGYADDFFELRQGEFIWNDSSGAVDHRCTYASGKENGPETYYYPDGQIKITGNNNNGDMDGEWTGYYPSGQISGKANYKKARQISGTFYHEDGSVNTGVTVFLRSSEFLGGVSSWLRFLNKTLRYPQLAVDHQIEGVVLIGFFVSKEGKLSDLQVYQSVDKLLDDEAMRVIRLTPDWQPAIAGGIAYDSYKIQPIVFRLYRP
jgi:TonB family protein